MKNLISCMIDKVGKKRITIKEIFEHPWMKKYFQNKVSNKSKSAGINGDHFFFTSYKEV